MGFGGGGMMGGGGGPGMRGPGGPDAGTAVSGNRPSLRKGLAALSVPSFRLLWFSSLASFVAMQMQMVARGWLAYEITGSFTAVGIVSVAWGIPMLLLSLVGGAMADRMDKRTIILVSQVGMGTLALFTAVLITFDLVTIPILFIMGLLQGTLFAFNGPARSALVPELVGEAQLMSAIAIQNAAMNATRIFGPVLAGILVGAYGVQAAYYVQSTMYLVVVGFVMALPRSLAYLAGAETRGSVVGEIGAGLRYIRGEKTLLGLMAMAFVPTALGFSYFVLLPGFAVNVLNLEPGVYGTLFTASGLGALTGSLIVASFTEFPRKALLQSIAGFGYGAGLLALGIGAATWGYPGALAGLAVLGLFSTTFMTLNSTMIMTTTQPEYYGRVMSIYMLTFSAMTFLAAPMGMIADRIGPITTFNMLGVAIIVFMAIAFMVNPKFVFKVTPVIVGDFPGPGGPGMGGHRMGAPGADDSSPAAGGANDGTPVAAAAPAAASASSPPATAPAAPDKRE